MFCTKGTHRGFTIIELMIAIGLIGILLAVALPQAVKWRGNARLKSAARDLYSNFQKAKLEAIKRNVPVVISFTPGTYQPAGKIGRYKVFVDDGAGGGTANDGLLNGTETTLVQEYMPQHVSLISTTFTDQVAGYTSRALPWKAHWGNVQLRNSNSKYYKILLSSAGFLRMARSDDGTTWH